MIVDQQAAEQFAAINEPDEVQMMEYGKGVGYWIAFPLDSFEDVPGYVRDGMVQALRDLEARGFKVSLHKRHDKPAYREFVKNLRTPELA